jgi:hypothetical protein
VAAWQIRASRSARAAAGNRWRSLSSVQRQSFEAGIAALFTAPGLVEGGRGMGEDREFIKGDARPGQGSATPPMKAGDMSMLTVVIGSGGALWAARCSAKSGDGRGLAPLGEEHDLAFGGLGRDGQIVVAAPRVEPVG